MTSSAMIQYTLQRHQAQIQQALEQAVTEVSSTVIASGAVDLRSYYGQMQYHLGWVDADFSPAVNNPGKLLRPMLLLLAYEAAGAWGLTATDANYLRRVLPAATAVELTHNFTLIHDDIEDGDT